MNEMGLLQDGRSIGSVSGAVKEKQGIGAVVRSDDPLDVTDFQAKMGLKYQEMNEKRRKGLIEAPRCYI